MPTFHKIAPYIDEFTTLIRTACDELGLVLDDGQIGSLLHYLDNLLLWTKAYNLTAITNPKEALIKHIIDCLAVVPAFDNAIKINQIQSVRLLDIGTGAGLPSVILAIVRPNWQITALDSNGKKVRFIKQMAGELSLKNISPVASRIEEFDETFTIITSRAFASLVDFVAVGKSRLQAGGVLCAMKGKVPSDELAVLSDYKQTVVPIKVPNLNDERCVIVLA